MKRDDQLWGAPFVARPWGALLAAIVFGAAACSTSGSSLARDSGTDADGTLGAETAEGDAADGGAEALDVAADQTEDDAPSTNDGADAGIDADASVDATDGSTPGDGASLETGGDAATEHGPVDGAAEVAPPACPTCVLYATYRTLGSQFNGLTTTEYQVDIVNNTPARLPLDKLVFRFWFSDQVIPGAWQCYSGCGNLASQLPFKTGVPSNPSAVWYLDVGFKSGTLDAFSDTGPLVQGITSQGGGIFVGGGGVDDYSVFKDDGMTPDPHIQILLDGQVVWGVAP